MSVTPVRDGEYGCQDCDFTTTYGFQAYEHRDRTNVFRTWDRDTGRPTRFGLVARAVGIAGAVTLAVVVVISMVTYKPPPPSNEPAKNIGGGVGEVDAPCGGIGDCNGDGIPDDMEDRIRRDALADAARDYCAGSLNEAACIEGVLNGDTVLEPEEPPRPEPGYGGYP